MFNNRGNPRYGYEDVALRDHHVSVLKSPSPHDLVADTTPGDASSAHSRTPLNPNPRNNSSGSANTQLPPYDPPLPSGSGTQYDPYPPADSPMDYPPLDGGIDSPDPTIRKFTGWLSSLSTGLQWIVVVIPILAIIWIPGILGLTVLPSTTVAGVGLLWWSVWLSVVWAGWWGALAFARIIPHIIRYTVGNIAVSTRQYIAWLSVLRIYVATFVWTLGVWISYQPLIDRRQEATASPKDQSLVSTIAKLLFAFFLCAALLLFEKFSIQWIAGKFHEQSYADRVEEEQRFIGVLVILYQHSTDIPGRSDTLEDDTSTKAPSLASSRFFQQALKGVKGVATFSSASLRTAAVEMTGGTVMSPNSAGTAVQLALTSANKTRLLARRLFYSFCKGKEYLVVADIAPFFPTSDAATAAFTLFDRDENGDLTRDEMEMACLEVHREQLSITNSMRDLDSAVGRLDNILMSVYTFVAMLIIAVALEAQVANLITGAGTIILGLSWLIGTSLQEVLTSIVFLFIKHPFDVGDRIEVGTPPVSYTVKEMQLLSTIMLDHNNCFVQAPNLVLSTLLIQNLRRSPQMSETFEFDVDYSTTFQQLEDLRVKMLDFVGQEKRDFVHSFDVVVVDIPEQSKMTLKADIKYKSNWQKVALKVQRRNKWICALKTALADLKIYGPSGDPGATGPPARFTQVPWETVQSEERKAKQVATAALVPPTSPAQWKLSDANAVIAGDTEDVFDEADELHMTNPRIIAQSRPTAAQAVALAASKPPLATV